MNLSVPIPQRGFTSNVASLGLEPGDQEFLFDQGRIYLICEKRMERTLRVLQEFYYSGSNTLCVTRLHPDLLQERMPGLAVETAWLSERCGPSNIPPNQLHRISQRIGAFLLGKKSALVLLEGVEYLTLFNEFTRVQMFLEQVNDQIMTSKAIMLVPIDPASMDVRSMARLRRFAEVVPPQYGSI